MKPLYQSIPDILRTHSFYLNIRNYLGMYIYDMSYIHIRTLNSNDVYRLILVLKFLILLYHK